MDQVQDYIYATFKRRGDAGAVGDLLRTVLADDVRPRVEL